MCAPRSLLITATAASCPHGRPIAVRPTLVASVSEYCATFASQVNVQLSKIAPYFTAESEPPLLPLNAVMYPPLLSNVSMEWI